MINIKQNAIRVSVILISLLIWEFLSDFDIVNKLLLPPPSTILLTLLNLTKNANFIEHFYFSLFRSLTGLFSALMVGIPLGLFAGYSKKFNLIIEPLISVTYPIPKITLLPILILFFGIGELSKTTLVFIACLYPIIINSIQGARNVDKIFIESAKSFNASNSQIFTKIVFPHSLPYIFSGIKIAIGLSLVFLFFAETVATSKGIGYFVMLSWSNLQIPEMFSGIFVVSILGVIFYFSVSLLEKVYLKWKI